MTNKISLLLLATAALTMAAEPKTVEAVKAADKAWAVATVKADEAAMARLMTADLQYIHSTGEIDTRESYIQKMKTAARVYERVDHEEMEVRLYGNTAVLTATAQVVTSTKGVSAPPAHLRFMHVWVYGKGRWQMVAHQSLRLPK